MTIVDPSLFGDQGGAGGQGEQSPGSSTPLDTTPNGGVPESPPAEQTTFDHALDALPNLDEARIGDLLETFFPGSKEREASRTAETPPATTAAPTPPAEDLTPDPVIPPSPGGPLWVEDGQGGAAGIPSAPAAPATATAPAPPITPDGWVTLPNGLRVSLERVQQLLAPNLDQAALRSQPPVQPTAPTPPASVPVPAIPQLTAEDLELADPATRALYSAYQAQAQQLAAVNQRINAEAQARINTQAAHNEALTVATRTQFQREYEIPDALMDEITMTAARSGAIRTYMQDRVHPVTGLPVDPDPSKAVWTALEMGFWASPAGRQLDYDRQRQRDGLAAARKQKLAGIGGNSGSSPRTTTRAPQTQAERHDAATQFVAETFFSQDGAAS